MQSICITVFISLTTFIWRIRGPQIYIIDLGRSSSVYDEIAVLRGGLQFNDIAVVLKYPHGAFR